MPANLENSAMATGLEKVSFHSNPKEGLNCDIRWITEKASTFQKNIYLCFIDYTKAFDCVDHNKLENYEKDGNTSPPYLPPVKSVCRSRSNS